MIEIKNLTKIFDKNKAVLDDFSISFNRGELIVIKGRSGSGKSTLLSLIAGIAKPTSGEVIVDGKHISKLNDYFLSRYRRQNIGMIFQNYNLIADLSVEENIALALIPFNFSQNEVKSKVQSVMEMFHINHKADALVKNLSGGEQQRCAIARANVAQPKIILADEPTANLDEELSLRFIKILREMKSQSKTIIVATHDPLFFELDFVDRIVNFDS